MAKVNLNESIGMALSSLWANKMRTLLTLLGIIIGVLTIIAVISVIQGLNNFVYSELAEFGTNDFVVSKMSLTSLSITELREMMRRKDLTLDHMRLLRQQCQSCELVGASVQTIQTVKYGRRSLKDVNISGKTYLDTNIGRIIELDRGRHFQKEDEERSRYVCVIGSDIAEHLFPYSDPLGKRIKIGANNFLVIGVGEKIGSFFGLNQDNFAMIPITTYYKIMGSRQSVNINIHTSSQELMAEAQEEVRTILRSSRHLRFNEKDDFGIRTSETFVQIYKSVTTGIFFAMILISSLALVVGGIVVMNIMLVSVTERKNEIGLRMAVGARRKDILFQFLIEAVTLSTTGGIIGILFGFIIAKLVSTTTPLPSSVDPLSIAIAIFVSMSIGIFFGIYPASKASRLNPIEALRSER
ncbi:MAG: ABC transporter permease [Candidatus Aminicenantes bacterium]|nr:ABC transporter permease [Candidatus Aminicenantes bacterium]